MFLVDLYGEFGGLGAMMMGWHKLEFDTFAVNEGFETGGSLVVEHLKDGAEATVSGIGVQGRIGPYEFVFAAGFEESTKYGVAVMIMENH